ncbi:MAG: hypothetical protein HND56_12725 [Pseudomonadota bacterium]|nr:hypothetical protein [Pseudomonadota bacterium]QKK06489.1 MAG: hypothetical protein HND56_12725 [Pseudomonadota bacterium]
MIKYGIITIFCLGIYSSVAFASQQKNAATCSPEKAVYKPHPKYKLLENEGIDLTLTISREGVTNPDVYGHYADFVIDVYDVKKQHLRAKIKLRWSCSGGSYPTCSTGIGNGRNLAVVGLDKDYGGGPPRTAGEYSSHTLVFPWMGSSVHYSFMYPDKRKRYYFPQEEDVDHPYFFFPEVWLFESCKAP